MLGTIDDVYMTFPASTGTTLSSRVIKLHPAIRAREQMALVDELRSAANYMGEATTSGDDISAGKVMKECTKSVIGAGTSPAVLAALFDKQKDAEGTARFLPYYPNPNPIHQESSYVCRPAGPPACTRVCVV